MTETTPSKFRQLWLPLAWIGGAAMLFFGSTNGRFDAAGKQYGTIGQESYEAH